MLVRQFLNHAPQPPALVQFHLACSRLGEDAVYHQQQVCTSSVWLKVQWFKAGEYRLVAQLFVDTYATAQVKLQICLGY